MVDVVRRRGRRKAAERGDRRELLGQAAIKVRGHGLAGVRRGPSCPPTGCRPAGPALRPGRLPGAGGAPGLPDLADAGHRGHPSIRDWWGTRPEAIGDTGHRAGF